METLCEVKILAFGQIAEDLDTREKIVQLQTGTTVQQLVEDLGQEHWLGQGLAVAVNGDKVDVDFRITNSCEIALLPPVSGG